MIAKFHIYYSEKLTPDTTVILPDRTSHHLCTVLRLKKETPLSLFNGDGYAYQAVLIEPHKRKTIVKIKEKLIERRESPLHITVAQALAKGDKMDFMLQKAVELGANAFIPLLTDYHQVKLTPERLAKRKQHWQQVIISACEQSKRNVIPTLQEPVAFDRWLMDQSIDPTVSVVMCDPRSKQLLSDLNTRPKRVIICIGPEGGFSEDEIAKAKQQGVKTFRFGPRILRTETAAMAVIAALQSRWGDLG